jgi:hypothetical protein
MYVRDTALVQILCSVGYSPSRARTLERRIDDQLCGLTSSDDLAAAILRFARSTAFRAIRCMEEESPEIRGETERRLELFERSAYGVYAPSVALAPPRASGTSASGV